MKTYKHLYEIYISDENITEAAHDATLGKIKHEFLQEIKADTDRFRPSIRRWADDFYNSYHKPIQIYDGITRKKRTIIVPSDKEQIVHHMLINPIRPMIMRSMYEHAYGSVPGRGAEKCAGYIKKAIRNHPKDCKYCLKMDIRHYFDSIDRKILKAKLKRKIADEKFYTKICLVIEYDKLGEMLHISKMKGISELFSCGRPTDLWFEFQEAVALGNLDYAQKIIRNLFIPWSLRETLETIATSERRGIPLGFYTSQWLSQFFLEDLDHFIKEQLGAEFYWRYVDDMVIFGRSKRKLHKTEQAIEEFLQGENLQMKGNWQVFRFDYIGTDGKHHGRDLDFLGYRFFCDRTTLRRSIMLKCTRKAARIYKKGNFTAYDSRQMLSYLGRIDHSDTYNMYLEWVKPIVNIKKCKRKVSAYDKARKGNTCTQREATRNQKQPTPRAQPSITTTAPSSQSRKSQMSRQGRHTRSTPTPKKRSPRTSGASS